MEQELQQLLQVLASSEDRDEKLEALRRIDEIAQSRADIRIQLDDDDSEGDSSDSDTFADIPLPDTMVTLPADGIPLPAPLPNPLDAIPLPPTSKPSDTGSSNDGVAAATDKSTDTLRNTPKDRKSVSKTAAAKANAESGGSVDNGDAVHAQTSIGVITVHLNRKLGPRLSRASVFDLPDESAKEVSRKLLRLRKLKRLKKNKEGTETAEEGAARKRNEVEERIMSWKKELLDDQNMRARRAQKRSAAKNLTVNANDVVASISTETNLDGKSSLNPTGTDLRKSTSSTEPVSDAPSKPEPEKPKLAIVGQTPPKKTEEVSLHQLMDSFIKVQSKDDDRVQLDWPVEMVRETGLTPKLVYSCNPLYFSFRKSLREHRVSEGSPGKVQSAEKSRNNQVKHRKGAERDENQTPSHGESLKTEGQADGQQRSSGGKSKPPKSRSDTSTSSKAVSHHKLAADVNHSVSKTEAGQNAAGKHEAVKQKKHSRQDKDSVTKNEDGVPVVKDTARSRWDTSSDSEMETSASAPKAETIEERLCRLPFEQVNIKKNTRSPPLSQNRRRAARQSSSESSSRSRKRSRNYTRSPSTDRDSSCSRSSRRSSSYRSSSYSSYHSRVGRRRSRSGSSRRRSHSYTDSESDYDRRHSRSYTRSRSNRRRWRRHKTRSYTHSYSSHSRSSSRSPSRHRSLGRRGSSRRDLPLRRRPSPAWQSSRRTAISDAPPVQRKVTAGLLQQRQKTPVVEKKNTPDKTSSSATLAKAIDMAVTEDVKPNMEELSAIAASSASVAQQEEAAAAATDSLQTIPTPDEHMDSIPLPTLSTEQSAAGQGPQFIGPVLPSDHPLAHTQEIPLPATAKFQPIGPNDPLVFRSLPPPPPPPASLTSPGAPFNPSDPPKFPSPPDEPEEDIEGDEDPIPQMLDLGTIQPMMIPPEQADQYKALQRQAELHARRQRIREETGMDIADEEPETADVAQDEAQQQQQLLEQLLLEQSQQQALMSNANLIHLQQQRLMGQPLTSSMAMMSNGSGGFIPVHMVHGGAAGGGLLGLEQSMIQMIPQPGGGHMMVSMPTAAAAMARAAQEEADAEAAEAAARQQAAAQAMYAAAVAQQQQQQQRVEMVQLMRMPNGQMAMVQMVQNPAAAAQGIPLSALRASHGIQMHSLPVHALGAHASQSLFHIPTSGIIGLPPSMLGGVQMIAQQQPQLVIGPNGTILRLIR